ncbi:MAG: zinc ribbon domain-containing protein [Bacteroidales bacterium]|nr:zinc ribbon domain-containing protein [Bacteroidales bacterium]MCL2132879.1 zinc ribbon domain-containing protein [Bacteroidales bacterium]
MKKTCNKCGEDNTINSKYCRNCGYELPYNAIEETSENIPAKPKRKITRANLIGIIVGAVVMISISTIFQKWIFSAPTIDKVLIKAADELNKMCPIMADSETRCDNAIALPNKRFLYNYTLINFEKGMIDTLEAKKLLAPNMINSIRTLPDMKLFRDKKITITYSYKDKNGNYMFSIVVTPEQYTQ